MTPPATSVPPFRVGEGWDVHALVPGRPLVLGGVTVPHHSGLLGHSDADALLHAITDALLGAAGLGDIGTLFPDSDARFRGADSRVLLAEALRQVQDQGWAVANVDCTVVAQAPRLAAHKAATPHSWHSHQIGKKPANTATDAAGMPHASHLALGRRRRSLHVSARAASRKKLGTK